MGKKVLRRKDDEKEPLSKSIGKLVKRIAMKVSRKNNDEEKGLVESVMEEAAWADKLTEVWQGISHLFVIRILYPIFKLGKYWGIERRAARISLGSLVVLMWAAAAYIAATSLLGAFSLAVALIIALVLPGLVILLLANTSSLGEKCFWASIFATSGIYVCGIMPHHIFWKLATIQFTTFSFWFTLLLLALIAIPTLIAAYHIHVTIRSYIVLQLEQWSKVGRSRTGSFSLIRLFLIWKWFYKEWFKEFQEIEDKHMQLFPSDQTVAENIAEDIIWLHKKMYLSDEEAKNWLDALAGKKNGKFSRPKSKKARMVIYNKFFSISQKKPDTDVYAVLESNSSNLHAFKEKYLFAPEDYLLPGTFDNHPDKRLKALKSEFEKQGFDFKAILTMLVEKGYITKEECIIPSFNGLDDEFKNVLGNKYTEQQFDQIEAILNESLDGVKTNLLGYMARKYKGAEWDNVIERIRRSTGRDDVADALANIEFDGREWEWADVSTMLIGKKWTVQKKFQELKTHFEMTLDSDYDDKKKEQIYAILKQISEEGIVTEDNFSELDVDKNALFRNLTQNGYLAVRGLFTDSAKDKKDLADVLNILSAWISEMRPSNYAATEAMGLDQFEMQLYVGAQLGDYE